MTTADVLKIATDKFHSTDVKLEPVNASTNQRAGLQREDKILAIQSKSLPVAIILAGPDEHIHSLRIVFPVVNNTNDANDRAADFLSTLFGRLYPNWPDARSWPTESFSASWNVYPPTTKNLPKDRNDFLIRKSYDGITSTTFGVPPDIVVYAVTSREQCIPDANKNNPFQRVIC